MAEVIAYQQFNGGIVFVSYIISVIGSMTTLELLSRRTHIRGRVNWFLLFAAALSMGSVGIWSMHFIGNNSLTITFVNSPYSYQLAYAPGYTFASLIVAIACMFISFSFVGVSEHVQIFRIVVSGCLAGCGIATMHYIGQFAIEFFAVVYSPAYVAGAVIIACVAVTAALLIFFKLREQWANQWYKRLGCAMIMGVAVSGMHFTAMAGTNYLDVSNGAMPPRPILGTPVLIGLICGVVVVACLLLFYVGVRCSVQSLSEHEHKKRLVVDLVLFDSQGRIMVNVDGVIPHREILSDLQFKQTRLEFSPSHPLYIRLFELVTHWSGIPTPEDFDRSSHSDEFNFAERRFHEATTDLMNSLRMDDASQLGLLYERVIKTHTIENPGMIQQKALAVKHQFETITRRQKRPHDIESINAHDDLTYMLSSMPAPPSITAVDTEMVSITTGMTKNSVDDHTSPTTTKNNSRSGSPTPFGDTNLSSKRSSSLNVMQHLQQHSQQSRLSSSSTSSLTVDGIQADEGDEERHIVLVRQLLNDKDIHRLMAQGYRFAHASFISRVMAQRLHIPNEHMLQHFLDMFRLAASPHNMFKSLKSTLPTIKVGLLGLVDEDQTNQQIKVIVDQRTRYTFPLVDLKYQDTQEPVRHLSVEERQCIATIFSGHTLTQLSDIDRHINLFPRTSTTSRNTTTSLGANSYFSPSQATSFTLNGTPSSSLHEQSHDQVSFSSVSSSPPRSLTSTMNNSPLHNAASDSTSPISPASPSMLPSQQQQHQQKHHQATKSQNFHTINRLAEALEVAARQLIQAAGPNAIHLGLSKATLHSEVVEAPAFSMSPEPCSILLFRICLRAKGTTASIEQHAASQSVQCRPYLLVSSLAHAISQKAADQYEESNDYQQSQYGTRPSSWEASHYYQPLPQQPPTSAMHPYQRQQMNMISSEPSSYTPSSGNAPLSPSMSSPARSNSKSSLPPNILTSLPPPPRAKRNRRHETAASSPTSPTIAIGKNSPKLASASPSLLDTMTMKPVEPALVILPSKDRFLWLDQAIVECVHSIAT
ncbi:hypothetical protein BC940DRAFT_300581 [Gongronella butleri]|nr:hypothetical protein BC940DRAFT_300581 [Gongronella butleri]